MLSPRSIIPVGITVASVLFDTSDRDLCGTLERIGTHYLREHGGTGVLKQRLLALYISLNVAKGFLP